MVDKAAEDDQGFESILKELDKTFKYDDQVEMPRAFERFFYGTLRRDGQTLLNYVASHREALTEIEKQGIKLPDTVAGWVLLRRAGLTSEQKQLVQGRAPDLSQRGVTEAMYFLFLVKISRGSQAIDIGEEKALELPRIDGPSDIMAT